MGDIDAVVKGLQELSQSSETDPKETLHKALKDNSMARLNRRARLVIHPWQ